MTKIKWLFSKANKKPIPYECYLDEEDKFWKLKETQTHFIGGFDSQEECIYNELKVMINEDKERAKLRKHLVNLLMDENGN